MWEVNSLNHSDTRYGVSRTIVNSQGRFQLEKFPKHISHLRICGCTSQQIKQNCCIKTTLKSGRPEIPFRL
jgi:hypothetical protein